MNFRPLTFNEIIGQNAAKEILQLRVDAFKKTGQSTGHVLMLGPAGTGKTTLGKVFGQALGVKVHEVMGSRITRWTELLEYIQQLNENDILFVDEIHALRPKIQEELYGIMEDFQYDGWAFRNYGTEKYKTKISVKPFTLIGATTHAGNLNSPLLRRFALQVVLEPYTEVELYNIIQKAANKAYEIQVPSRVGWALAKLSRRSAANANNLLKNLMELAEASVKGPVAPSHLTLQLVEKLLRLQRIDPVLGLDATTRKYLVALVSERTAVGVKTLATLVGEQQETLTSMIEPFLMQSVDLPVWVKQPDGTKTREVRRGPMVKATRRGRQATTIAKNYVEMCRGAQKNAGWFPNENLTLTTEDYVVVGSSE